MLAGYVWNGLVHGHAGKATGGALLLGAAAAVTHACCPAFEADKFALSTALDLKVLEDPDGGRRRRAEAPPALPPFDPTALRGALFKLLPFREVPDEEAERMKSTQGAMTISLRSRRGCFQVAGACAGVCGLAVLAAAVLH